MAKKFLILSEIEKTKANQDCIIPFFSALSDKNLLKKKYNHNYDYINKYSSNEQLIIKDAKYLENIYEKVLVELSKKLNLSHNKNFSLNFWRILIGPWLGMFIYIYFLKWKTIANIKNKNTLFKVKFYKFTKDFLIPKNMRDFTSFINLECWQQKIGQKICLHFFKNKNVINVKYFHQKKIVLQEQGTLKRSLLYLFNLIPFKKSNRYLILNSYLGFFRELFLNFKFLQFPSFVTYEKKFNSSKKNFSLRDEIKKNLKKNKLDKFANNLINDLTDEIPSTFLEDFDKLEKLSRKLNFPSNPKVIFSSNFRISTLVSYYIAKKKEDGAKLLIGQHGGLYGATLFSWFEKHEIKTCDKFLSWGWLEKSKKVKRIGILVKTKEINWNNKNKRILIFLRSRNKYPASFLSGTNTESYLNYSQHLSKFFNKVLPHIKKNFLLRLPPNFKVINQIKFFNDVKNLKFDNSPEMFSHLNKSILAINTTHSTPFLQIMSINFPNILILNGKDNPFKDKKSFKMLKKVKIYHDNFKSAANFLNSLDEPQKIFNWWYKNDTQKVVKNFCFNHAFKNENLIKDLKNIILEK